MIQGMDTDVNQVTRTTTTTTTRTALTFMMKRCEAGKGEDSVMECRWYVVVLVGGMVGTRYLLTYYGYPQLGRAAIGGMDSLEGRINPHTA